MGEQISITTIDSLVTGYPEMYFFYTEKFLSSDAIRKQYEKVAFYGSTRLEERLIKLFTEENLRVSLFNATNMKLLFEYGSEIGIDNETGEYETYKMTQLEDFMGGKITSNELFAVYAYLVNLIEGTFLRKESDDNTFDKVSMSFALSDVIRNEFEYFRTIFTSKMIGAVAHKYLSLDDCKESFLRLFPRKSASISCDHAVLDITTTHGVEFWFRLYIGRRPEDELLLKELTGKTLADFNEDFISDDSDFVFFTQSIMDGIGMGFLETLCLNNENIWCSVQEISFHQMMNGIITKNPPPILQSFQSQDNYIDFFGLEDPTLITPEFNYLLKFHELALDPAVDVRYEDIISGMRDSRLFNPFYILGILNDRCGDMPKYCTQNFKIWLAFLYRNRALPPLVKEMTIKDIFNGTESEYLTHIQRKSPKLGGDPTVRTSFNILPYEGKFKNKLKFELFSGDRNEDRAKNILIFDGQYEYITTERSFYHVDSVPSKTGVQNRRINPWTYKIFTAAATDGSQFMPDMTNRDDLVFYTDYFKAIIRIDFQSVMNIYGLKGFIFETPISLYEK